MANYNELKNEFNNSKYLIERVLNDKKCQIRLKSLGFVILSYLFNEVSKKVDKLPKYDNCEYSFISLNGSLSEEDREALNRLKKFGLIRIIEKKGGFTKVIYKYCVLNFENFNKFFINTQKNYHPRLSLA